MAPTFWTIARRSLCYHWRAHMGVLLGAAIGTGVLVGALAVGDRTLNLIPTRDGRGGLYRGPSCRRLRKHTKDLRKHDKIAWEIRGIL